MRQENSRLPYFIVINGLMTYMIQFPAAPQDKGQPGQLGWPFLYRFAVQESIFPDYLVHHIVNSLIHESKVILVSLFIELK